MTARQWFVVLSIALLLLVAALHSYWAPAAWLLVPVLAFILLDESTVPPDWKSDWAGAAADHW